MLHAAVHDDGAAAAPAHGVARRLELGDHAPRDDALRLEPRHLVTVRVGVGVGVGGYGSGPGWGLGIGSGLGLAGGGVTSSRLSVGSSLPPSAGAASSTPATSVSSSSARAPSAAAIAPDMVSALTL